MKETGIIFTGELIPKVIDGSKTMTRRVLCLESDIKLWERWNSRGDGKHIESQGIAIKGRRFTIQDEDFPRGMECHCPYGQVGDRLWVRETWYVDDWHYTDGRVFRINYPADNTRIKYVNVEYEDTQHPSFTDEQFKKLKKFCNAKKHPSIFLFKFLSRINLEITNIRVERLQEITIDDINKEGFPRELLKGISVGMLGMTTHNHNKFVRLHFDWIRELWNKINEKRGYSWKSNPWVWVIEFKKI